MNSIAVIIPTYRRGKYLLNTIEMLLNQSLLPDEIIIVDQTPIEEIKKDESYKRLYEIIKRENIIKYIRQKEPYVYKARNLGAKISNSEILLYLDDDIIPDKNLVKVHLENYKDQRIAAVVGLVKFKNWKPVKSPNEFKYWTPIRQAFEYYPYINPLKKIAFMYAGNFSIRKKVLLKVGGWDENILTYGDRELGLRLYKKGYRIDYDPSAMVFHLVAPTGGTRLNDNRSPWRSYERSSSIFYIAFKYLNGTMFLKYGVYRAMRHTFLLKKNLKNPFKIVTEILGFIKGAFIAFKKAKRNKR